jgi:hypothetical protein
VSWPAFSVDVALALDVVLTIVLRLAVFTGVLAPARLVEALRAFGCAVGCAERDAVLVVRCAELWCGVALARGWRA